MDTLLNLSGGIDSVYCLYQYVLRGEPLYIHHINLKNREGRNEKEAKAVSDVLSWADSQGYKYEYIETAFDYGDIRRLLADIEVVGIMTGVVARARKGVKKTLVCSSLTDKNYRGLAL